MALIFDPRWFAHDDDGNPLVGATLTVYVANTVTPAAIKRDAALAVPMTNPTSGPDVSNAAGIFPQVFSADGGLFDILLKDADGNLVRSYEDVSVLGSDTGDFSRTVSGDGRITITGSAGAVSIQAGSPSPDNIGGDLTIEGQAGTQLDTLTLDSVTTDFTGEVTTRGGKKLTGAVQTAATTFTTVASVDIALVEIPADVRAWRIDLFDMSTTEAGGDAAFIRLSYDGGASYRAGASDYSYLTTLTIAGSVVAANSTGATAIVLANGFETAANELAHFELFVLTPESGATATIVKCEGCYTDPGAANAPAMSRTFGRGLGSYGRATHIRILAASGETITGKYRLTPLYGFGEA